MNFVYLLRCSDGTLYCGWTTGLTDRVAAHNAGTGAKYTRSRRPVELVYYEEYEERHEALSREWHLKRMRREDKLKLINGGMENGIQRTDSGTAKRKSIPFRTDPRGAGPDPQGSTAGAVLEKLTDDALVCGGNPGQA